MLLVFLLNDMYNNYDYPVGADTPDAPWNEVDPPEQLFNLAISCSLSKDAEVTSDNYEEGEFSNTINEPWNAYIDQEYTVNQIIDFAKKCAEYMLNKHDYSIDNKFTLKKMIDSCKGWTVDEENAEQV